MKAFLILATCVYSNFAFGACSDIFIQEVRNKIGLGQIINEYSDFTTCKPIPDRPNESIVAISKRQPGTEINDSLEMGDYNLDIVIANEEKAKILIHKTFKNRFTSDGYRFSGIEIDTGRYFVSKKQRAFGIRSNHQIDLGFQNAQNLSLFLVSGRDIKEILSDAEMHIFYTNQQNYCNYDTREATRTLSFLNKKTNNLNNILVTESLIDSKYSQNARNADKCIKENTSKEIKKYELYFDGGKYVIPAEMEWFECRIC